MTISTTTRATGGPAPLAGVLALVAALVVVFDVLVERLAPGTDAPAIRGSRELTRLVLAALAALFIALKFVLHPRFSQLRLGFYFAVVAVAALVLLTILARQAEPKRARRKEEEEIRRAEEEEARDDEQEEDGGEEDEEDGGEEDEEDGGDGEDEEDGGEQEDED